MSTQLAGQNPLHPLHKQTPPDGYTLLFGHAGTHAINPAMSKLAYDPIKDFQPVTNLMSFASVLVVPKDSPVKNVADLVALAASKPDGLSYVHHKASVLEGTCLARCFAPRPA